ncbi:MAG TPA: hypothetical protein VNK49_10330 [Anaerolineales bacterium]|nr:hypothetical protein [Anaerolineales bacterium]
MKTAKHYVILAILFFAILLNACGSPVTVTEIVIVTATIPPATNTPDPCAPENIEASVQAVHKYMREFDDASTLAASQPREQLADSIANLQRIRREAEDQPTPACLAALKTYQISHMNSVINTLIAFMGGADQQTVDQGIAIAREQHDRYTLELARVLGLTVVPAVTITPPAQTPTP